MFTSRSAGCQQRDWRVVRRTDVGGDHAAGVNRLAVASQQFDARWTVAKFSHVTRAAFAARMRNAAEIERQLVAVDVTWCTRDGDACDDFVQRWILSRT